MDIQEQTKDWIRALGYDGEIPENLAGICNNSTAFIWNQLMQNVRPKVEVENIRDNVLVHRLNESGLNSNITDKSQYPLEEISVYKKKGDLEKEVKNINCKIKEKQDKNHNLIQQNNVKQFSIEKMKLKIKENEEREFLLQRKLTNTAKDIEHAENILSSNINSSLVDSDEIANSKDITQMLHECKKDLDENVKELHLPLKTVSNEHLRTLISSAQKSAKKDNMFEQYLQLTERKTAKKIEKRIHDKENTGRKINICLFNDDNIEKTKLEKLNFSDRRDSLEMDIEDNDDENFLVDLRKTSFLTTPISKPNKRDVLNTILEEEEASCSSKGTKRKCWNKEKTTSLLESVSNERIRNNIKLLLDKYNRHSIWNVFCVLDDTAHFNISKMVNFRHINCPSTNLKIEDRARLQSLHVKTEFKIIKNNVMIRHLTEKINEKKSCLDHSFTNSGYPEEVIVNLQRNLKLEMEDTSLDCVLEAMKREINSIQNSLKLTDITDKKPNLMEIRNEIAKKKASILQYMELIQETLTSINRTRTITSSYMRKLAPLTNDLSWCTLLAKNVNTVEIETFEEFPLEFNRKFVNTDSSVYYRDMHTDKFLYNREITNESINLLSDILGSPFKAPEIVILNMLRDKLKLNVLQTIKPLENRVEYKKHSLKDLHSQETYVANASNQLNALLESSASKKTLSAASTSKTVMDMWIEMPFGQCISPMKTFEGKTYKDYENMFDAFYNDMK